MHRKIVYLINPISGTRKKSSLKELITKESRHQQIAFEILYTNTAGNYNFLRNRILEEKITDIVICGGDGSVNSVAAALFGIDVNIGIIPMGSGNGLAFCAGIPADAGKALKIIFNGKASEVDGFFINGQFSCMLSGVGLDARVAHEFSHQKRRGLQTYLRLCFNNYLYGQPYSFEVFTGTSSFKTEAFFISIANGNQFGNNFTIAPKASLSDGLLDIVIVRKMNKFLLPFAIFNQLAGFNITQDSRKIKRKNIIYFQAASLKIDNLSAAPLHIDGEPVQTSSSLDIKVISSAFRLIQP